MALLWLNMAHMFRKSPVLFRQLSAIALLLLYVGMQTAIVFPDKTDVSIQAIENTGTELSDNSDDSKIKTDHMPLFKFNNEHAARYVTGVHNLYLFEPQEPVLVIHTPPPRLV